MIHKELNHVNVVQMHHYFEDNLNVYMLLEACPRKVSYVSSWLTLPVYYFSRSAIFTEFRNDAAFETFARNVFTRVGTRRYIHTVYTVEFGIQLSQLTWNTDVRALTVIGSFGLLINRALILLRIARFRHLYSHIIPAKLAFIVQSHLRDLSRRVEIILHAALGKQLQIHCTCRPNGQDQNGRVFSSRRKESGTCTLHGWSADLFVPLGDDATRHQTNRLIILALSHDRLREHEVSARAIARRIARSDAKKFCEILRILGEKKCKPEVSL